MLVDHRKVQAAVSRIRERTIYVEHGGHVDQLQVAGSLEFASGLFLADVVLFTKLVNHAALHVAAEEVGADLVRAEQPLVLGIGQVLHVVLLVLALEVLEEGVQDLEAILLLLATYFDSVSEEDCYRIFLIVVHLCAEDLHLQGSLCISQVRLHDSIVELQELVRVESDSLQVTEA